MLILVGLLTILLLTAATGYFVAQEFSYVAVDRNRLQQLADEGDAPARRALQITSRLSFTLSGSQFGITLTALMVGYVSEPFLGEGLAEALGFSGLSEATRLSVALLIALVFSTVVQMVLGELAPKNLAIARTVQVARALSRSTLIYLAIAGPVIKLFDKASNALLRSVGIEPVEELPHGATPADLHRIIDESREAGSLGGELSRLLDRGLAFRELVARQVMTPRVDVLVISGQVPLSRFVELLETGRSRFPVTGRDADDILGIIGLAQLLTVPSQERATTPVSRVATSPLLVPETLPLPELLEQLRRGHSQIACVVDEYGGFAGVVSFEDIAEEVVGEILDEDDQFEATPSAGPDGCWTLPGRMRLDEVAQVTGIDLPGEADYDTVSGLVMDRLGRTPRPADRVSVTGTPRSAQGVGPSLTLTVLTVLRHVPATVTLRIDDSRDDKADTARNEKQEMDG